MMCCINDFEFTTENKSKAHYETKNMENQCTFMHSMPNKINEFCIYNCIHESTNKPIIPMHIKHQSIHQSTNQLTNQPINQPINQSTNQSIITHAMVSSATKHFRSENKKQIKNDLQTSWWRIIASKMSFLNG